MRVENDMELNGETWLWNALQPPAQGAAGRLAVKWQASEALHKVLEPGTSICLSLVSPILLIHS